MNERLLLVEDDDSIAEALFAHLTAAGFQLHREADGKEAILAIDRQDWDLVILDLMLPGADGWEVCRHLRATRPQAPVIMLSAHSAEAQRVLGLELGADDYIAKPFSMLELVARIRALFRRIEQMRVRPSAPTAEILFGVFRLDLRRRELERGQTVIPLTLREFGLLSFLARHPGRAFSRQELLREVWGEGYDGYEHTVNSHINRLRTKIEDDPGQPLLIKTLWGLGYRFDGGG